MRNRIKELENMFEAGELTLDNFEQELRSLVIYSEVYGLTAKEAQEMLEDMGYAEYAY